MGGTELPTLMAANQKDPDQISTSWRRAINWSCGYCQLTDAADVYLGIAQESDNGRITLVVVDA
jgi:hypothetical protein